MLEQIQLFDWKVLAWIQDVFCCDFMDFIMPKITAARFTAIQTTEPGSSAVILSKTELTTTAEQFIWIITIYILKTAL